MVLHERSSTTGRRRRPSGYPPTPPAPETGQRARGARLESSPRFLFKPTLQLGQSDQLTGFFETDSYTVDGRGAGANGRAERHAAPGFARSRAGTANYTKVLSTLVGVRREVLRLLGLLLPESRTTATTRRVGTTSKEDFYSVNSYNYFDNADRVRHQANACVQRSSNRAPAASTTSSSASSSSAATSRASWATPSETCISSQRAAYPMPRTPTEGI